MNGEHNPSRPGRRRLAVLVGRAAGTVRALIVVAFCVALLAAGAGFLWGLANVGESNVVTNPAAYQDQAPPCCGPAGGPAACC